MGGKLARAENLLGLFSDGLIAKGEAEGFLSSFPFSWKGPLIPSPGLMTGLMFYPAKIHELENRGESFLLL